MRELLATINNYKGVTTYIYEGDFAADINGRGGEVVWAHFDKTLHETVIGVVPATGPSYELRESLVSFVSRGDDDESK